MAVDPCTEYGLALAVEDFVPVVLAGAGALALASATGRALPRVRAAALAGGVVVTLGGLAKAVWKLLVAMEPCRQYDLLENLLFPCLMVGFSAIAWALTSVLRRRAVAWWPFALVPLVGAGCAVGLGSTMPMLGVAALAAVAVGVLAATLSRRHGDRLGAWLFVVYLAGTLVLPPLAAREHQTELVQWAEQLTNSLVQLCFLLGALRLRSRLGARSTPEVPEGERVR
ncbi:hypothetical protein CLV56_0568 [Mumia flava]|uniref:Uncharacterized protein n=1 Tax=Mumia flava TaxID=1348852 RepID=A0A0B2BL91_9ACTN|nr:hypothetical protein [Mumia flava]PJJ56362.1 hypothetical protein CLV56_0568 [Mumia flava]